MRTPYPWTVGTMSLKILSCSLSCAELIHCAALCCTRKVNWPCWYAPPAIILTSALFRLQSGGSDVTQMLKRSDGIRAGKASATVNKKLARVCACVCVCGSEKQAFC